jgi:hypothetical protein
MQNEEEIAMQATQRFVEYIQWLAYESLSQHDERDERPSDALPPAPSPVANIAAWNPTSFAAYVPFRCPPNG